MLKRIVCCLLVCLMLFTLIACNDDEPQQNPPETDAPATDAPATDAPATDAPTTDAPTTDAPTTDAPTTDAPTTDAPTTDAPTTDAPTTDAPTTDAPTTGAPTTDAPGGNTEAGEDDPWGGEDDPWGGEDDPWGGEEDENTDSEEDLTDSTEQGGDASQEGPREEGEGWVTDAVGNILQEDEILRLDKTNYGGTEIRILQKDTTQHEMYAKSKIGELINDAVYDRNKYVEDYVGVKLKYEMAPATTTVYDQFEARVDAAVQSGYDMYHVVANYTYQAANLIQEGAFLDINTIPAEDNYIDLSKRWWNQAFHDECSINDKLYLLTGDITTTIIDRAEVIFVNNDMLGTYMEMTSDELLDLVYEMGWTYETFLNMVHDVGNGKETGEWGFAANRDSYSLDGMIMGMAMDLTYRDSYNYPNLHINTNKNIEIGDRLRSLYQSDPSSNCAEYGPSVFASGKAMFMSHLLENAGSTLRSTTIDYMVIPEPLYDEYQEEYRIVPQDNYSSLSILCHVTTATEVVTRTLEVMGSESYINLRHCIQEKCYKQRYLKTEPKGKMFDYIVDNIYQEFGYTYTKVLEHPVQLIRNYARYLPGEGAYVESLTTSLETTEVLAVQKLADFLKHFFD
ncbi:MAG: hypothetical protein IKA76_04465 [Clostridia bacterium]|nr:hypothetical protein [Clostridia bacterium]